MNEYQVKVANKINTIVQKYELIILLVVLLSIAMKLLTVPFFEQIFIPLLGIISTVYFFTSMAVSENNEITAIDKFAQKIIGLASAMTLIGILFTIQKWPNYELMILVGSISLSFALIYLIIRKTKNPEIEIFNKFLIIRVFILILVSVGLFYFGIK